VSQVPDIRIVTSVRSTNNSSSSCILMISDPFPLHQNDKMSSLPRERHMTTKFAIIQETLQH
jgi:hypothetical protein